MAQDLQLISAARPDYDKLIQPNFRLSEFHNKKVAEHLFDFNLIKACQIVREYVQVPVIVTCTHRTEAENKYLYNKGISAVKTFGKGNSHFDGVAVDFGFKRDAGYHIHALRTIFVNGIKLYNGRGVIAEDLFGDVYNCGVRGFGFYFNHIHFDTRILTCPVYWDVNVA